MRILPDVWNVPQALRERVGTHIGKQRLIEHQGHAVLLLHRVPEPGAHDRQGIAFWRDPEGSWRSAPGRDGIATLRAHVESYSEMLATLDDQLDASTRAHDYFAVLRATRPVQRAARHMHVVMQQLRELVPNDAEILALRDRAYEIERTADLLSEDADHGLQLVAAQRAEEQAVQSERIATQTQRLNQLAALFLPTTALGAILGMNLQSGLEPLPHPLTFWALVALAFAVGLLMRSLVMPKRDVEPPKR